MTEPWLLQARQGLDEAAYQLHEAAQLLRVTGAPWKSVDELVTKAKRSIAVALVELTAARTEHARLERAERQAALAGQGTLTGDQDVSDEDDPTEMREYEMRFPDQDDSR